MSGIGKKIFTFFVAMMPILLGIGQAFAEPVQEFTLHRGQSMFVSADHLQQKDMLTSENDAVATVLDGIITANLEGEAFCREVRTTSNGEKQEKRFKIKVLPPKLIRYVFVEPNNPRPGEGLTLVAISDMVVNRVKFLVTTNLGCFEAISEEKFPEGDCFIHKARINARGSGKFMVKTQVQSGFSWIDTPESSFDGSFIDDTATNSAKMRVSNRCIDYIKAKEGFKSSLREDSIARNVYDIGYGSGVRSGVAFYNNVTRTVAHAMLVNRLNNGSGSRILNNFILRNGLVLSQHEFDALLSFTYNIGPGWLSNSTLRNVYLRFKNTNGLMLDPPKKRTTGIVTSTNGLRLRKGPSIQSKILTVLKFNERVDVLSENQNGWYKVRTSSGLEGYCFAEFLSVTTEYTNSNIGVVSSDNGLRLRESSSTESRVESVLRFNEQVEVLSDNNNGWYKVRTSSGLEGYCFAQFLTIMPPDDRGSVSKDDVVKEFLKYNKSGGKFVKGLLNRRVEELQIYFYGDYSRDGGKNKYNFLLPDLA